MYYLMGIVTQTTTQSNIQETFENALSSQSLTNYITACLENSLQEGLLLLGKQGGFLYQDQGSIISRSSVDTIDIEQDAVSYLIIGTPMHPPWYPCYTYTNPPNSYYCNFSNNISRYDKLYSHFYGINNLPKGINSIQKQLEAYISSYVKECASPSSLIQIPELAGYTITSENITSNVNFGINDVSVILDYPFKLQLENRQTSKTVSYGAKINVRFNRIYAAVNDIIQKDNNYLDYRLVQDTENGLFIDQNKTTHLLKFRQLFGAELTKTSVDIYNDLVVIKDPLSKIKGQPYVFQFAVQNRNPALDYIEEIVIDANNQLTISPSAADPDEDPIRISYEGWRYNDFPSLFVDEFDIGQHKTTVKASDSILIDYQELEIQICHPGTNVGILPDICIEKCGASLQCNNQQLSSVLATCTINPYLNDLCNDICQLITANICGCNTADECLGIAPYTNINNSGWCYGNSGCTSFCTTEIVSQDRTIDQNDACGCSAGLDTYNCDADFDGIFEGACLDIDKNGVWECSLQQQT
ncbi:hypothetical protein GOV06_00675 [Candidatus Woesearchaeota archaeon]|nr:hypothetical protein [Candidatus Woesearchaeota archaeon]